MRRPLNGKSLFSGGNVLSTVTLQPVRIPTGWRLTHNTLWEADPNAEQIADGFYGSSSVFLAIHERGRFIVNVEWRPFNDPKGRFLIRLLYAPFARTERGRRTETRVEFRGSQVVREIEATSRASLVGELEALLAYGAETQQEAN